MSTRSKGQYAEGLVIQHLVSNGHILVGRNIYGKGGELDVVTRKGRTIYIYEVKSHVVQSESFIFDPLLSITPQKVERMRQVYYQKIVHRYPTLIPKFIAVSVRLMQNVPRFVFVEII